MTRKTMSSIKCYSELIRYSTFEDRLNYLKLWGTVGRETFGFDRYINQRFYKRSKEWEEVRRYVIIRDNGCDLGIPGYELYHKILIHHMNPLTIDDIIDSTDNLLNPEYLISVSLQTHNIIHYGDNLSLKAATFTERKPNDTCPWRK